MPYEISWHIKDHVIYVCGKQSFAETDLARLNQEISHFIEAGIAPIHVIMDMPIHLRWASISPLKLKAAFNPVRV